MFSPFGLSIDARDRMLREAKARLESMPPPNAGHVNESSETEARATPATMGRSVSAVARETVEPSSATPSPHVKTGSAALTI